MMGNVPPLSVGVRESPDVVAKWAKSCLDKAAPGGGMILSVGGGVSPDMPAENMDAMLDVARTWTKPATPPGELDAEVIISATENETGSQRRKSRRRRRPRLN